jgi:hypothetical protein
MRFIVLLLLLALVACVQAASDLVTPGFSVQYLAGLQVDGSGYPTQVREFKTKEGTYCIVATNAYHSVALACDFRQRQQ